MSLTLLILYTILSATPALLIYLYKCIFENITIKNISVNYIILLVILYIFIEIMNHIINYFTFVFTYKLEYKFEKYISSNVFKKIKEIECRYLDDYKIYDKILLVKKSLSNKSVNIIHSIAEIFGIVIKIIMYSIILGSIHWIFPIAIIVFSIPYIKMYKKMNFDNYFLNNQQARLHRKNWYLVKMLFDKTANREMKFCNIFDYIGEKQKSINTELHAKSYNLTKKYAIYGMILDMLKVIVKVICIMGVIYLIINGHSVALLAVAITSIDEVQRSLIDLFSKFKEWSEVLLIYDDYKFIMSLNNEIDEEKQNTDWNKEFDIELKNVSLRYDNEEKYALKNINLKISSNEKVVLVGKNGSGKTSLVNLILGLYNCTEGQILINKTDIKYNVKELRKHSIYISQNTPRYPFSIDENIYMGNQNNIEDELKELEIAKITAKKIKGADAELGETTADGNDLSGGEWARIGIVRNLNKENIDLCILDEPTAALDPFFEERIYKRFSKLMQNITTIFVSHRLGIAKFADRIIVLDDGKIVEEGTHIELMKSKGLYYDMFMAQRSLYVKAGDV